MKAALDRPGTRCAPSGCGRRSGRRYRDHGQKGVIIQGLSGIDIALWDLKGKFFNQPIHRLLGGPIRSEVPAYATGLYRRKGGDPVGYLAEEVADYVEQG